LHKVIYLMIFFFYGVVHASSVDSIITINQKSSSGKTILIDKGSHHKITFDEYGVLLKQFTVNSKPVFKPVAKLKAVKVFGESSVWVIFKTFLPEQIQKDARLMLLSESALMEGRTPLKITRTKVVGHENIINKQVVDGIKEGTEGLSKRENKYGQLRKLHDKEKHYNSDANLLDINAWEDKAKDKNYRPTAIYTSPYAKEFSERKRVDTFEKMVVAFLRKYNDPKFTLQQMYEQQKKNKYIDTFVQNSAGGSYFDRYRDGVKKEKEKEKKIYDDLRLKGEAWSDDYSDEELSELIYNVGVIKERERRTQIAAHKFDHQFYGHFGLNLVNNENLSDRNNTEQSKYDVEFGWEYFFLKDVDLLNRFSIELNGRRAVDAFSIGDGYNVTITEYSLAAQVNWYPFIKPNILERNIVYFGIVFRTGLSRIKLSDTNEEGNYQVSTLPGFRGGVKYNFGNSWGLRLQGGYENINVARIVRTYDGGLLPDRANYIEGKLSLGLSKFY
jgi:hypothetical protein